MSLVAQSGSRPIAWADLVPLHRRLEVRGITSAAFPSYLKNLRETNARRVREGDLDHLVFYLLQSTRFTKLPPIEPALSAKELVDALPVEKRKAFLSDPSVGRPHVPGSVRARISALLQTFERPSGDARLTYFRDLVSSSFADPRGREPLLASEYLRAMRFVYEKEFVAQRSPRPQETVAELYRTRGLSTDTSVEAGYLVYQGLAILKALEPTRRIRRVLIVGPGLDLAPRTALDEEGPPQSYQPWTVIDALLSLELSRADDLIVVGTDINRRVVDHLRRARAHPPVLTLASEIRTSDAVTVSDDFREYFRRVGSATAENAANARPQASGNGQLRKTIRIRPEVAATVQAETLDIVTERLDGPPFDLAIATNILPYFDDVQLMLALSNVAAMLAPGGVLLHNEARPLVGDVTAALNLPFQQSRHGTIATVRGAPPLGDSVWIHKRIAHP